MKIEDISFADRRIRIKGDIVYNKQFIEALETIFGKNSISINFNTKSLKIESDEIIEISQLDEVLSKEEIMPLGERVCMTDLHPFISRSIKSSPLKLLLYTIDYGFRIGLIRFLWVNVLFNKVVINFL